MKNNYQIKYLMLFISVLFLSFIQVSPLYKQSTSSQFQLIPPLSLISKKQFFFSPNADKIAVLYTNQFQYITYMKIVRVSDGVTICQNGSPQFNSHNLTGFSYDSGPITSRYDTYNKNFTLYIWSMACKIQQSWYKTPLKYGDQFRLSKQNDTSYIGFINQNNISEYKIVNESQVRVYFPAQNQKFNQYHFIYSQNHQYLMVQAYSYIQNSSISISPRLITFDCSTGQQAFSINKPIFPLKFIKNNSHFIGQNQVSKDLYVYDLQGHYRLINIQQQYYDFLQYKFCTYENYLLVSFYKQQEKSFKIHVYNTDINENDTYNDLRQVLVFQEEKYGRIMRFICEGDKIAVLNEEGYVRVYAYQPEKKEQDNQYIYLWSLGGLILIAIILGAFTRIKCKFHKDTDHKISFQYKESLIQSQPKVKEKVYRKSKSPIKEEIQQSLIKSQIVSADNRLSYQNNLRISLVLNEQEKQYKDEDKDYIDIHNDEIKARMARKTYQNERNSRNSLNAQIQRKSLGYQIRKSLGVGYQKINKINNQKIIQNAKIFNKPQSSTNNISTNQSYSNQKLTINSNNYIDNTNSKLSQTTKLQK